MGRFFRVLERAEQMAALERQQQEAVRDEAISKPPAAAIQLDKVQRGERVISSMGNHGFGQGGGIAETLRALGRRKWLSMLTLGVTAAALWTAAAFRPPAYMATCLTAVKKPSQVFMVGKDGNLSNASVPLLEGRGYGDVVNSIAFATRVADVFAQGESPSQSPSQLSGSARYIKEHLQAVFRDPDLLQVQAHGQEPTATIRLANMACRTLVEFNQAEFRAEIEEQAKFLAQLLEESRKEVESAQTALTAYMQQEGLVNVDLYKSSSDLSHTLQLITEQEMARTEEEAALQEAEERLRALTQRNGGIATMLDFPVEDPAVTALRSQVESVRQQLWDALGEFTNAAPVVQDLRSQLADLQHEMDRQLRREFRPSAEHRLIIRQQIAETHKEIRSHKTKIAHQSRLIEEQRGTLATVPHQRAKLETLRLSVTFAEDRFQTLSRRLNETRLNLGAIKGNISIVQPSVAVEQPSPLQGRLVAVLLLLTLPLGVGLLADYMDNTVQSPIAFSHQVGLPCLATVPKTWRLCLAGMLHRAPIGNHLEAFHVLQTGLYVAAGDRVPRCLAVVGARHGEGRSTLVLNLAYALAQDGRRVLIIDADLHHTGLARRLGMTSEGGLVEVLTGERALGEVCQQTRFGNLSLLPAKATGRVLPPNVEQLFQTQDFKRVVDQLSLQSDIMLFDTAPITTFVDPRDLLMHMDGVIIIAEAGNATQAWEDVHRTLDLMQSSQAKSLGIVLNKTRRAGW